VSAVSISVSLIVVCRLFTVGLVVSGCFVFLVTCGLIRFVVVGVVFLVGSGIVL
jgi:hypothetical protein